MLVLYCSFTVEILGVTVADELISSSHYEMFGLIFVYFAQCIRQMISCDCRMANIHFLQKISAIHVISCFFVTVFSGMWSNTTWTSSAWSSCRTKWKRWLPVSWSSYDRPTSARWWWRVNPAPPAVFLWLYSVHQSTSSSLFARRQHVDGHLGGPGLRDGALAGEGHRSRGHAPKGFPPCLHHLAAQGGACTRHQSGDSQKSKEDRAGFCVAASKFRTFLGV